MSSPYQRIDDKFWHERNTDKPVDFPEFHPQNASYYRREMKKLQAELTELRSFKQRVMELQPVGYFTNDNNDKYKFDDAAIPLYDLKGVKE